MPIESRTVLTCGQCGADKSEANGWYLIFITVSQSIVIRRANESENLSDCKGADAACGRECVIKLASKALGELRHIESKPGTKWKRERQG